MENERPSLTSLQEAVCLDPQSGRALAALGRAFGRRGELPDAIRFMQAALRAEPRHATYHYVLGDFLSLAGRLDDACAAFTASLNCVDGALQAPSVPFDALASLAELQIRGLDRLPHGLQLCARMIEIDPNQLRPYELFCLAASPQDESPAALLERIQAGLPSSARPDLLRLGLCQALVDVGRYEDARLGLEREWHNDPDSALIAARLGLVEHVLGDKEQARAHLMRATELARPARADREAWGTAVLHAWRTGDYQRVLALMRDGSDRERSMRIPAPRNAEAFDGQTVIIWMTSVRWAPLARVLHACGAHAVIECETRMRRLMEAVDDVDAAVVPHDELPPFNDYQKAFQLLSSLDWAWDEFRNWTPPCLTIPAAVTRLWRARTAAYGRGLHVGIDWRAPGHTIDRDPYTSCSIPLAQLRPISEAPGVICHSLHVGGAGARELAASSPAVRLTTLSDAIGDSLDAAAAISALDLIVTADTEVAHLAGVLGKPTLLMLPAYPDWIWGDRDSPFNWYPTLRRFQQRRPGDWAPVIHEAAEAVRAMSLAELAVTAL